MPKTLIQGVMRLLNIINPAFSIGSLLHTNRKSMEGIMKAIMDRLAQIHELGLTNSIKEPFGLLTGFFFLYNVFLFSFPLQS